ncbi:MAG: protein-glutamate O-methyltransferase CheR [Bacteroidia bacterium]|nr:protein-glutamate O-methyltransferase CheR [Bacteroidia bacterium]
MTVTEQDLQVFINAVKNISAYDFTEYSEKSLMRRLEKVLSDNQMELHEFIKKLTQDSIFLEKTVKDITVNTTELFRDPVAWHMLKYQVIPALSSRDVINIWHAGCSTGQEVYSMLILLCEMNLFDKSNIYATDINTDVIEASKKGIYKYRFNLGYLDNFDKVLKENPNNPGEIKDVSYSKYFEINKVKDIITMNKFLINKPIYKKHDLVRDPNPFEVVYDLILCRNVIIYFNYNLQNKVFGLFYNNLSMDGSLLLGMHESMLGPISSRFEKKAQLYTKSKKFNPV